MGRGPLELELKFRGDPAEIAGLREAAFLKPYCDGAGRWMRLRAQYYDTPDGALSRLGLSLRVRKGEGEAGSLRQTIKCDTAAGPIVREEFSCALYPGAPFPAPTGEGSIDNAIGAVRDRLEKLPEIDVDRWRAPLDFQGGRFELALDVGAAAGQTPGRALPIAEAEIEYVEGDLAATFALARLVVANTGLRLSFWSKSDRAHASAGASAEAGLYHLGKLSRPAVDPDAPAADAMQAMLGAMAARIGAVEPLIHDLRRPRGVHQMRVALRRFRSVERVFRKAVDSPVLRGLARRARHYGHALGPARDWDVFLDETLPTVFDATGGLPDMPDETAQMALREGAEAARAQAWSEAQALIASREFSRFHIDLIEAAVAAPWRADLTPAGSGPLRDYATMALARSAQNVSRAEEAMDPGSLAARHPLRIALKKHRYAAQMLGRISARSRRKPYMRVLSDLQDGLGVVNDAVVAQALAEAAAGARDRGAMRAADFVSGYKLAEAEAALRQIDLAWQAYEGAPPFWRPE